MRYDTILLPTDEVAAEAGVECVAATKGGPHVHEEVNDYVEEAGIDAIGCGLRFQGLDGRRAR